MPYRSQPIPDGSLRAWTAIAAIFALFTAVMTSGCSMNSKGDPIAVINGEKVYFDELEVLGVLALSKSGLSLSSEEGQKRFKEILPNLYESLIDIYALRIMAEKEGLEPSKEDVDAAFQQIKDELTSRDQYDETLKALGVDEDGFKESIKHHLAKQMLEQQRLEKFSYEPDDKTIEDYYYKNNLQFRYPYCIRASHIFVGATLEEGDEAREKARERAEQLRKMIGDNPAQTFAQLASRYSQDGKSRQQGGDLGYIFRNSEEYNEPFMKAAFRLAEGEVSDVVETDFGYHIIWCTDHEMSLEEAKPYVKQQLYLQKAREYHQQLIDEAKKAIEVERLFDPKTFEFKKAS
ncbi:MAG: hypothetical protein GC154_02980 [bacterium]|nr:hypothetical protein [bacterium]